MFCFVERTDLGSLSCFCKDLLFKQVFHLGSVSCVGHTDAACKWGKKQKQNPADPGEDKSGGKLW